MKIFGIGLSRTGTSSLHLALLTMGIPAIHYPRKMAQYWMRGIFNRKVQADYDAYTDIPTALYFREVYRRQHRLIDQYFAKYPNQLLKLDISEGENWQKLTDFLKLPQLDRGPYPHLKYPKLGDLTAVSRQAMTDHRSEILRKIQALTQPSN